MDPNDPSYYPDPEDKIYTHFLGEEVEVYHQKMRLGLEEYDINKRIEKEAKQRRASVLFAVRCQDRELFDEIIERVKDVDKERNDNGETALFDVLTFKNNNLYFFRRLLEKGASLFRVNHRGMSPLNIILRYVHRLEDVRFLDFVMLALKQGVTFTEFKERVYCNICCKYCCWKEIHPEPLVYFTMLSLHVFLPEEKGIPSDIVRRLHSFLA